MTIVAGFYCRNNILLCADREESSGTSKKVVEKLQTVLADPWVMTIASAGSGPACDLAVKRLGEEFFRIFSNQQFDVSALDARHEQGIVDVLTKLHADHIWNNPKTDHRMRLIIGISFTELKKQYLYMTEDNIPQPIKTYCCAGYGEDLCTYFAERLYKRALTSDEMILLAALIFREVNSSVQFCGKGTDMMLLRPGELALTILPEGVEAIQRTIPPFEKVMSKFWKSTKSLPGWITAIGEASKKVDGIPEE
jgi:20S proteasome alpha/beta subunit